MTWDVSAYREFQDAKRAIDMRELVSRDYRIVDGCIPCPWHAERTPSCKVYSDHLYCYGCQKHADAVDYIMQQHGISFAEAKKEVLRIVGAPEPPYARPVAAVPKRTRAKPLPEERQREIESRRLDRLPLTLQHRGISLAEARLLHAWRDGEDALIPLYDVTGRIVQIKRRLNQEHRKYRYEITGNGAKPWISPMIEYHRTLVMREGEFNAAVVWLKRPDLGVVGIAGAAQKPPLHLLARKTVYVWADDDEAGRRATERWVQLAAPVAAEVYRLPYHPKDPCEIADGNPEALRLWLTAAMKTAEPFPP